MRRKIVLLMLGCVVGMYSAQAQEVQHPVSGHYYSIITTTPLGDVWAALQADAVTAGGNLVTIRDAAENQWILDNIGPLATDGSLFIGFNDKAVEGAYEWVSGDPSVYTNWNTGEPNDSGNEDIVEMRMGDGLWNDNDATQNQGGIMERIVFEFKITPVAAGGPFITPGTNVVLTGEAWGTSTPITYQWKKNGVAIGGETSATLTLLSVTGADDGSYTLEATDSAETIVSATVVILVVAPGTLPVGGTVALGLAAGCVALAGALQLRRRRNQ